MIVVVMGVSGVGKTTVGRCLAERLGARFLEGDRYHPAANVEKMRRGEPLSDADRQPWLETLAGELVACRARGESVVLACSALRRRYRDILRAGSRRSGTSADAVSDFAEAAKCHDGVGFVFLDAAQAVIQRRLDMRRDHFMPPSLLDSQFAALEKPGADECAISADAAQAPEAIVELVLHELRRRPD